MGFSGGKLWRTLTPTRHLACSGPLPAAFGRAPCPTSRPLVPPPPDRTRQLTKLHAGPKLSRMKSGILTVALLLQCGLAWAQQRPLITERANTVEGGDVLVDLGFEFLQDAVFPLSGLEGDLTRVGVLGVRVGVADRVEFQLLGSIQDFLSVNRRFPAPNSGLLDFSGNSTSDFGDFTLATKIRLNEERLGRPALSFRFGVDLPNASNESGLGVDETNVFGSILVEKNFPRLRLMGNAGIVILGDPRNLSSQDDLFTYGAAVLAKASSRLNLLAEIYGRSGDGGIGTEDQSRVRAGIQIVTGSVYWDVAGFWGIKDTDPSSGVIVGISNTFHLF